MCGEILLLPRRRHILRLPDLTEAERDALGEPLACLISAQRRTSVAPGDTVAVIGLGFMGLGMVQLLKL